jgi:hypothetical protein
VCAPARQEERAHPRSVTAPPAVRGGLVFASSARAAGIAHPRLVLDEGCVEGMRFNSTEPAPVARRVATGVVLSYDRVDAGDRLVVWEESEVDPTNIGHRPYGLDTSRKIGFLTALSA